MALNDINVDFGTLPLVGTIAGLRFDDTNQNGVRDGGENVLPGRYIFLDNNNNGSLDTGEPFTISNAQGVYGFTALPAGLYRIRVPESFFTQITTQRDVNLTAGQNLGADIGSFYFGNRLKGLVFNDTNRNGIRDAGDSGGLANVQVFIDNNNNNRFDEGEFNTRSSQGFFSVNPRASTVQGEYSLILPSGVHRIRVVVPDGLIKTTPDQDITLTAQQEQSLDIGLAPNVGTIAGVIFTDSNRNGIRDAGESLRAGTVFIDNNNNGRHDVDEPIRSSNAQGIYGFSGLVPGLYRIREFTPSGFIRTTHNLDITLAGGQNVGLDIGNAPLPRGSIAGVKFNDFNRNGVRDGGEPGIPGVQIFIDNNDNGTIESFDPVSVTNAEGAYGFANLLPGTYRLREIVPAGFLQTTPNPNLTLAVGQNLGVDFGNALIV